MDNTLDIINRILKRRLHQPDIVSTLDALNEGNRDEFLVKVTDILAKVTALLDVARKISDILELNLILEKITEITTEAINADEGFLFLNDNETGELFSRVSQGELVSENRFPNQSGVAGSVFTSGKPILINDACADDRFNKEVDNKKGRPIKIKNILCAPIKTGNGKIIGVIQLLNKKDGLFNEDDLDLLEAITTQASTALQNAQRFDHMQKVREEESHLLEIAASISSELQLKPLLAKIMETTADMLNAERSTLFLYDEKKNELWSEVAMGLESEEIRFPSHLGIAGTVFTTGDTINIPEAYKDDRFNPDVDKKTGYITRNILCMPVNNKEGKTIGVAQVLNKKGGPFTKVDENWLWAFSTQASTAIENAKLFDEVLNMKNYNESILESLTNGVISMDSQKIIIKCNSASLRILDTTAEEMMGAGIEKYFSNNENKWVLEHIDEVVQTGVPYMVLDTELIFDHDKKASVNMMIVPLKNVKQEPIGSMLVLEDLTNEKRLKSTMARYMTKEVAEKLLLAGDAVLGGQLQEATILFSDIRSFTAISEKVGAHETVRMLNEYFTIMVDVIFRYGGVLDKYIGDAIMAVYGAPFTSGEDPDRAVMAAVEMLRELKGYNEMRVRDKKDPIAIGVGINTDEVVAGNIGSIKRMDYTVIGDGVNLASRLEKANKYYGTSILISEFTFRQLKGDFLYREVDRLRVKGKAQPVSVYEILDYHDKTSFKNLADVVELYHEGVALYREAKWKESIVKLEKALSLNKSDRVTKLCIERCQFFLHNPPGDSWDGVWTLQEK